MCITFLYFIMFIIYNIIFSLLGILYFGMYYLFGYDKIFLDLFVQYDFGRQIFSYLNGFVGALFTIGFIGVLTSLFRKIINKFFPNAILNDFIIKLIHFSKYILALQVFTYFVIISSSAHKFLTKVYSIGIIVLIIFSLTTLVKSFFNHKLIQNPKFKTPEGKTLLPFISKILNSIIWIIGSITIFDNLGYNISAFIAGAGIGGLAIAFAAQKTISQIFGAVSILLNKPFKVGDSVTLNGVQGVVKEIGITYVTVIENQGHTVMIPNDATISSNIENFSIRKNRRTDIILNIDNKTPTTKLENGIDEIKKLLDNYVSKKTIGSYRVNFDKYTEFSIDINITYFSLLNDDFDAYVKQKENINFEVKESFDRLGIEMAKLDQKAVATRVVQSIGKATK